MGWKGNDYWVVVWPACFRGPAVFNLSCLILFSPVRRLHDQLDQWTLRHVQVSGQPRRHLQPAHSVLLYRGGGAINELFFVVLYIPLSVVLCCGVLCGGVWWCVVLCCVVWCCVVLCMYCVVLCCVMLMIAIPRIYL